MGSRTFEVRVAKPAPFQFGKHYDNKRSKALDQVYGEPTPEQLEELMQELELDE